MGQVLQDLTQVEEIGIVEGWTTVDTTKLAPRAKASYDQYVAARKAANTARVAFEKDYSASHPAMPGMQWKFGYKFGRLSVLEVEGSSEPRKASKPLFDPSSRIRSI